MLSFLNRLIHWSFYALFFFVPLVFVGDTSELFEFNKLWLTFALTVIIGAAWIAKMILQGRIRIQRTPLDIPIVFFLVSQCISTIISLDTHTSLWGYYSRFNGGLLSLLAYIFLYYAFVSNVKKEQFLKYLYTIILSGIVVALWGLPSHFGYDPTCLVFRGTFDVSCWTFAFQPKVRIFSTLGQPDWLSAYLAALIPLTIGTGLYFWQKSKKLMASGYLLVAILFYVDFLFAKSRAGFLGLVISLIAFFAWYVWQEKKKIFLHYWYILALLLCLVFFTFIIGTTITQIDTFTLPSLISKLQKHTAAIQPTTPAVAKTTVSTGELGGTDSGKIRLFVWQGAIQAWLHYPIFGTGVETFAYAYYLFMPPGHNLTSEFGYLYNKAHNEYLNYLATTGIVGLGTYLAMIGWLLFVVIKKLMLDDRRLKIDKETGSQQLLIASLLSTYVGILIINFFGFSVVIINMFLFIVPGFIFLLQEQLDVEKEFAFPKIINHKSSIINPSPIQWIVSAGIGVLALYFLYTLFTYWQADRAFGLGQNLVNAGDFQNAYQPLHQAVNMRPGEPTFQDEVALDDAVLAVALTQQSKSSKGTPTQLAQEAVAISNDLTTTHPNVVTYWKTRVRVMYSLAQLNPQYLGDALTAIQRAQQLAPTDAKISYNLGLILGQTGRAQEAISVLQNTIRLKSDYRDAYYALGIFYHSLGVDKSGKILNADDAQKAIDEMHFILTNFGKDQQASDALKAWGAQ